MLRRLIKTKPVSTEEFLKNLLSKNFNEHKIDNLFEVSDIDINWQDEEGKSFLHICEEKNLRESIKWLIKNNANLEIEDKNKETALFYAIKENHSHMVKLLIENKANANHQNSYERIPFQEAIYASNMNIVDFLIPLTKNLNNADIYGHNAIFDAVMSGQIEFISKISKIKEINMNQIDKEGDCVLHKAVKLQNSKMAFALLDIGIDPNIKDKQGKNFLFHAISHPTSAHELLDKAIEKGADTKAKNKEDNTLIMETLYKIRELKEDEIEKKELLQSILKKLLDKNIDLDAENKFKETALFIALKMKDLELVHLLIEAEVNINYKNKNGENALFQMILLGIEYINETLFLIKHGANLNERNDKKETILEQLCDIVLFMERKKELNDESLERKIHIDGQYLAMIKRLLMTNKIDLNMLTSKGKPIFFDAIFYKHELLYKLLKACKINLNLKDSNKNNILNNLMSDAERKYNFTKMEYLTTIKSLIIAGVDVNSRDSKGATNLHNAVLSNCEQTLKTYLDSKGNLQAQDRQGRTVVHNCVWDSKIGHFSLIHSHDNDIINKPDSFGVLPINYAAFLGKRDLVIKLLESEAFINNPHKKSPKILEFFSKFHDNLDKLSEEEDSELNKMNLNMLIKNMKEEFLVKKKG